jgi:hypothetical protein
LARHTGAERALPEHVAQRPALHELHDDPRLPVLDGDVVDVDHGRVVEPGRGARLAAHPLEDRVAFALRQVVGDAGLLDGDLAVDRLVVGAPHGAHPAVAELAQQPVPAGDEPARPRGGLWRHLRVRGPRVRVPGDRPAVGGRPRRAQVVARGVVRTALGSPVVVHATSLPRAAAGDPPGPGGCDRADASGAGQSALATPTGQDTPVPPMPQ